MICFGKVVSNYPSASEYNVCGDSAQRPDTFGVLVRFGGISEERHKVADRSSR